MKFFKPEDFAPLTIMQTPHPKDVTLFRQHLADLANAKLEREIKLATGYQDKNGRWFFSNNKSPQDTHTAQMIKIEPIEKCTHPSQKVTPLEYLVSSSQGMVLGKKEFKDYTYTVYQCECGAKVKPTSYEEC